MSGILEDLALRVAARRHASPDESWTACLLSRGPAACAAKFGEEAVEAAIEAARGDRERLTHEVADVLYHLVVMMEATGASLTDVERTLRARHGQSGVEEKASRSSA